MGDDSLFLPLSDICWLTAITFEVKFERPSGYTFRPGQKVILSRGNLSREYSLISSPEDDSLCFCIRRVQGGGFSSLLANADAGDRFRVSAARGYFSYQSKERLAVFVATGTGVAPFVSFTRAGVKGYIFLHGVRNINELYYRTLLLKGASQYIPCISDGYDGGGVESCEDMYTGRVTTYLETELPNGNYDFYLCGSGGMIRDAIRILDKRFPKSRIFTESFFLQSR